MNKNAPVAKPEPMLSEEAPAEATAKRGKLRISESARARLLDASDLSRFEIKKPRQSGLKSSADFEKRRHSDNRGKRSDKPHFERTNRKNNDRGSIRRGSKKKQG